MVRELLVSLGLDPVTLDHDPAAAVLGPWPRVRDGRGCSPQVPRSGRPFSGYTLRQGAKSGAKIGAMDLSNDIEPVTALKRSAADLIARATDRHSPIVITQNGKPTAVLQDVHSYQRQQRALHLLKLLAQGEHDHRAGRLHDQASVDGLVSARLAERRGAS